MSCGEGGRTDPRVSVVVDPADPRLADYVDLPGGRRRDALERALGIFVIEGHNALARSGTSAYELRSVLTTPAKLDRVLADLGARPTPVLVVERALMSGVCGFEVHRGVLAIAERPPGTPLSEVAAGASLLLALEGVNDHENLGVLFRTASAFGVDGVVLDPLTADPLYRRSVRVSMGEVLHVPFVRPEVAWPRTLDDLAAAGFELVALTPAEHAQELSAVAASLAAQGRRRVALLVGAEGPGLAPSTLARADRCVRIQMRPGVDSLNVATAAGIALHALAAIEPPASHE